MAVAVRGGVVTSVEFAGEEFTVVPPLPERFVPVEELFALLQDAVRRNAARIEVSYDERYGYPTELFIDYDERMADEETRFVIRGVYAPVATTRVYRCQCQSMACGATVPGRYSATRDSEQTAAPATFSPAMWCSSQQTCESRDERVSPAGSSSRRGRSGRAWRARVSPAPSCQERRPRPQMLT